MPPESPDPPKEESEPIQNVEEGFLPIAGDEEGSEDSGLEYESDSDEDVNGNGVNFAAHYHLLIPFPDFNPDEVPAEFSELSNVGQNQSNQIPTNSIETELKIQETESQKHPDSKPERREITMEEDKVEKIKTVMQNFSLPSTAVPSWASEIDEDQWKSKLFETINKVKK